MTRIRSLFALALLAFWAAAPSGCGQRSETRESVTLDTLLDSTAVPVSGASESPEPGSDVDPATVVSDTSAPAPSDVGQLRAGIRAQQSALERAARAGHLVAIRNPALRLRDLAVALQGKVKNLPAGDLAQVEQSVGEITQSTDTLRQHADRGDVAGVRSDVSALGQSVGTLLRVTQRAT